ncbi:MAG: hypothetical protein Q4D60_11465 [Eubacteriales bacterium]|nr:hypothetical protein [Eubacteriales bacterium]
MRLRKEEKKREKKGMEKRGIRRMLAAVFCGGLLLTGIGVGVGLVEASGFDYAGEVSVGGEERVSKTITAKLDRGEEEKNKIYCHLYTPQRMMEEESVCKVETSKKVSRDEIQFVVEYNPNNVSDVVMHKEYDYGFYETADEADQGDTYTMYYLHGQEPEDRSLKLFLEYKDEVLKNLKEKKIAVWKYPTIYSMKIIVHPSNKKLLAF